MSTTTPAPLLYRCPVCDSEVSVDGGLVDEVITCPNDDCRQPIEINPPQAEFEGEREEQNETALTATNAASTEKTLHKLHPSMFGQAPLRFSALVLGVAAATVGIVYGFATESSWLMWASLVVAAALAVTYLAWWIVVIATTLRVTTSRTILRHGIFEKETNEVQHDDVRNIQVDQTVLDRLVGIGRLAISSSGQSGLEIVVQGIAHPSEIAETVRANQ